MNFGVILHWPRLFRLVVLNVLNSHTGGVDCGIIDSIGGQTWLRRAYELAANEKASEYALIKNRRAVRYNPREFRLRAQYPPFFLLRFPID